MKRLWECAKFIMGCLMEGLQVEKGRYLGGSGRKRSGNIAGRWDKRGETTGKRQWYSTPVSLCLVLGHHNLFGIHI